MGWINRLGTHGEVRFVCGRDGYWRVADVTFDKEGNPLDWRALSTIDDRIYMNSLASPDAHKRVAEFLLKAYEAPRIYEKGVILTEGEA